MVYDALAPIYDRIMSHVEYRRWMELINRIVADQCDGIRPDIFEIGAGTGVLGALLRDAGYDYLGSDLSYAMCRQARARRLPVAVADARCLPAACSAGLILFLYDGINYLKTTREWTDLCWEVHRCLGPRGLFLFDITTRTNSMRYFSEYVDHEDLDDCFYLRRSHFDSAQNIQYNDFVIFSCSADDPQRFVRARERHVQKLFAPKAIRAMIPAELFTVVGVWDGYSMEPYRADSERIHFLLRKRDAR